MKEIFAGITWTAVEYWPVAIVLAIALIILIQQLKRRKAVRAVLQPSTHAHHLLHHASVSRFVVKALLIVVGLFFMWLALLRPQWNNKEEMVTQEGRDLMIVLDVSRSMLAGDVEPSRLEFTKKKIHALVNRLSSDRVGLLLFSGDAVVQCPLTSDFQAFFMFLDQVTVETISSGTTALDSALQKALALFKQGASRNNKLLLVFTDGEDFSTNLRGVRTAVQQENVILFTIGVGTAQGAPIPLFDSRGKPAGHQKDKNGAIVISRLNEPLLHELAQETGGNYMKLKSDDDSDIDTLISRVNKFEKEKFDDKKMSGLEDQYPYFLMVSFFCFALEWLL